MRTAVVWLFCAFFLSILSVAVLADSGCEGKGSYALCREWRLKENASRYAVYELLIDKDIYSMVFHLVTGAKRIYPDIDKIDISLIGRRDETIRIVEIDNEGLPDLGAVHDYVYLIVPEDNQFDAPIRIKKVRIKLVGGIDSYPSLSKESYIKVITENTGSFLKFFTANKHGDAGAKSYGIKPAVGAYVGAATGICPGFKHDRSYVRAVYGQRFLAPRRGSADITTNFFFAGIGNGIGVESAISASSGAWQARINTGIMDLTSSKWIRGPEPLARFSVGYGLEDEEVLGMTQEAIEDIADAVEEAEEAKKAKKVKRIKKVKVKGRYLKSIKKFLKEVGPGALTEAATMLLDFYDELQVDNVIVNGGLLNFRNVFLDKGSTYELRFPIDLYADAVCVGISGGAMSYVDFFDPPKKYVLGAKGELDLKNRGFYAFDVFISYKPIPLKTSLPEIKLYSPSQNAEFSSGEEITFKARVYGGTPPYRYEWYDYLQGAKAYKKIGEKTTKSEKNSVYAALKSGRHLIRVKVADKFGFEAEDWKIVNVIPDKPKLDIETEIKNNRIKLEWSDYGGSDLRGYDVLVRLNKEEPYVFYSFTQNNSIFYPYTEWLGDRNLCFKVRLKTTTGISVDSNEACAKIPIFLSLAEADVKKISLKWTLVQSRINDLVIRLKKGEGDWMSSKTAGVDITADIGGVEISGLKENTTYYFKVEDGSNLESNIVKARTLANKPPVINITNTSDVVVTPWHESFRDVRVVFSAPFKTIYISTDPGYNDKNAIVPKVKLATIEIRDDQGIEKIEWDFGRGFKKVEKSITQTYKPGKHNVRIRVTDRYGASTEATIPITILTKPMPPKISIKSDKLFEHAYGMLEISASAKDLDGQVSEVRFYACGDSDCTLHIGMIGTDKYGIDGWSILWDPSKYFDKDEWRKECSYVEAHGKKICSLQFYISATAVDNNGFESKELNELKKVSVLEPMPDLVAASAIEWTTPLDSELLDELGLGMLPSEAINETEAELQLGPKKVGLLIDKDEKGDYRIIGMIKNEGFGALEDAKISYQFYIKRKISCPAWYLRGLGCVFPEGPFVVNITNATQSGKTGFVCPRDSIASHGGGTPPSCTPLPECYCTLEIASGNVTIDELVSGDVVQVFATIPKEKLKSYAEEAEIGKKVEIIFVIDTANRVIEENEFNNAISRTIWIEGRLIPQLIKGGNPKSLWYGIGRFAEWLDLAFTFDRKAKFEKGLRQASKRLEEAGRMLKEGEFDLASELLKDYTNNVKRAQGFVAKLPEDEKLAQNKILMLFSSSNANLLKEMHGRYERLADDLESAINESIGIQDRAAKTILKDEPMAVPTLLQLESAWLRPNLMFVGVEMERQPLVNKTVAINFSILNRGDADSRFRIVLYEDGLVVQSIEEQVLCPGCTKNYSFLWTAKKGVSELSIGLEEPMDADLEDNYLSISIQVIEPKCYSDEECADDDPCTKDICIGKGTAEARCEHIPITQCRDDDGCCPAGCNVLNDNDCIAECGNDVCEPGEDKCNCPEDCGQCAGRCKAEPCWEWECVHGECQCELQPDCCGNGFCEEGEFFLNCEEFIFETDCETDCCVPYPIRMDFYPPDAMCSCPPGTQKIIVVPETGEFICECPPP